MMGLEAFSRQVKIYATDVDEEALAQARHASYTELDLKPVPEKLRDKYFEQVGNRFVFRADLRRAVIFGRNDLTQDAPISRLDLLICRNTLMYFNSETQVKILNRFHFALKNSGYLFLGKAEMLLTQTKLFTPVELKYRIFTVVPGGTQTHSFAGFSPIDEKENFNKTLDLRLSEAAFDGALAAQLVLDAKGKLAKLNERARELFGLSQSDIGRAFHTLEISYRPVDLRLLVDKVFAEGHPIQVNNVEYCRSDGEVQYLDFLLNLLQDEQGERLGTSIIFNDVTSAHQLQEEIQHSKQELETAHEELQSANEELETTNEELQSTIEELQTTNEELQSTNEEMETMNEELHSTNDELQSLNKALRERTNEVNVVNRFLESILAGLFVGVVVVDRSLNIVKWSKRAEDLWGVRADEAQGKSLLSMDIGLPLEKLVSSIRACLAGEMNHPEIVLDATNRRGKAIKCRVTSAPLISNEKAYDGVILLMEEWKKDGKVELHEA